MEGIRFFRLRHASLIDADPAEDLRECEVLDNTGNLIGVVEDSIADEDEERVRLLEVKVDPHLDPSYPTVIVPVDLLDRHEGNFVRLRDSLEHILAAPGCDMYSSDREWERLYRHFGCTPFWDPDYVERDMHYSLTTRT